MLSKRLYIVILLIIILFIRIELVIAESNDIEEYYCEQFGYISINKKNKSFTITKISSDNSKEILAKGNLNKIHKDYFIFESDWPGWDCVNNCEIHNLKNSTGDSIKVTVNFDTNYNDFTLLISSLRYNLTLKSKIDNKTINFYLKKFSKEYSLDIQPNVDPFPAYSSWGDNKTMGVLIFLDKQINVKDQDIEISIKNFNPDIFKLWYLDNEIVLRNKNSLFWNNFYFIRK